LIPLEARIVSLADVYDALTSDRPYRKAHSLDEAIEIMASMTGKAFDPNIAETFLSMLSYLPHNTATATLNSCIA
jgi:putative two-component system response regulator